MSVRGPIKRSHLRQVSAASLDTLSTSRSADTPPPHDAGSDCPLTPDEKNPRLSSTSLNRRQCSLWVHDETFSREEILFNQTAFSDTGVQVGDVIEILPARPAGDAAHHAGKADLGSRSLRESHFDSSSTLHADAISKFKTPLQSRCLCVVKPLPQDIKSRNPRLELSVTTSIANTFGFKNRDAVNISIVDRAQCAASHVDIAFRDQYMVRSDMWRLVMSELADKIIYKGQKIVFMGTIKATVKNIFVRGKKVLSGFFAPETIPVFRSESAKYVLFIQMSREMWDFDSEGTGDILFSRVINGFLPELFKRWANADARHLVTIVLFTRVEYDVSALGSATLSAENLESMLTPNHAPTRDFYRVVVNDMASGHWTTILDELKKDFRTFLRDVSILKTSEVDTPTADGKNGGWEPKATIAGRPSTAIRGNILEAIHLASAHLAYDHIDRDMIHTGTSIIVITPGSGVFEASYESLAATTEALMNRGIAIDLVCLSPMPLHSVPLFKYHEPVRRPSTSSVGDLRAGGNSPEETRYSFAGLASRTPHLSPRSTFHGSSFSGTSPREQWTSRSHEWHYGIPHWLDISYWNPETYRESRRILKKDPNAPIPYTVTKQSKVFVPRVRMYEIQMMGVMESEQSNISIPYLYESPSVSRGAASRFGLGSSSLAPPRASFRRSSPFRHPLSDSLRPEPFLQNMSNPKDAMAARSKKPSSVLSWMDSYDEAVFSPFPKRRQRRQPVKQKRPSEPEVQGTGAHERLSARSVLRLREQETLSNERNRSTGDPAPRNIEPGLSGPKGPGSSQGTAPKKPALKAPAAKRPPRISRTISFALRGLSATPPRAQASTEVNVEHVRGLPSSNKNSSGVSTTDAASGDSQSFSDSASASTVIDWSTTPVQPQRSRENSAITPSRPISIKMPSKQSVDDAEQAGRPAIAESYSTTNTDIPISEDAPHGGKMRRAPKVEITANAGSRDGQPRSPQSRALAPWVRPINPCNTPRELLRDTSWFGRWQHAYPRPPHVAVVKWKSLKSPAILPLTTEEFPTASELASEYLQTPYRVFPNDDAEGIEAPRSRGILLREMISLRLAHGFQIVVGKTVAEAAGQPSLECPNVFDPHSLEKDGATVYLSKGKSIHRLVCISSTEIEVTRFTHQTSAVTAREKASGYTTYTAAMRTILSPEYKLRNIRMDLSFEEYNWNYADNYVAGHRDYLFHPAQQLHFWRMRYVLIPVQLPAHSRRQIQSFNEDTEEEIHLLGISQLTQIWQRHKYVGPEEKRFETGHKKREQNPLNIMYQTRNPSDIVAAELDRILLTDPGLDNSPAQLLPESELLERPSVTVSSLAQIIQGDKGVRMMDRRWHWRLHYNCFIGFELTTWLQQNFRDIDTREDAVEFGNELMKHGLFQHVEKRHNFRDGNYFYQISSEYRIARPESRGGWFPHIRPDKPAPSTPAGDGAKESPASHPRADSVDHGPQTPATPSRTKNKATILLSKTMKYDVDPRKRSNRPEVIDLHYDRLHNPDNCFHIELSWMNTTPKLIEDAVLGWASTAERFGLKLVQVPVAEGSSIDQTQPFRKPYRVPLKVKPPTGPVPPTCFNPTAFSQQQGASDQHYFQKAILRKFDFVLDFEARSAFPPDVEVSYSWGIPDYRYSQYIHRSGSLIIQINEDGDFLVLANRLVSTRSAASRDMARHERMDHRPEPYRARASTYDPVDRISPRLSPVVRPIHEIHSPLSHYEHIHHPDSSNNVPRAPEQVLVGLIEFCNDAARLEQFYRESHVRPRSTKVEPTLGSVMDASIPSLELPASVVSHHISPPPALPSRGLQNSSPALSSLDARVRGRAESIGSGSPRIRPHASPRTLPASPRSGGLRPLRLG